AGHQPPHPGTDARQRRTEVHERRRDRVGGELCGAARRAGDVLERADDRGEASDGGVGSVRDAADMREHVDDRRRERADLPVQLVERAVQPTEQPRERQARDEDRDAREQDTASDQDVPNERAVDPRTQNRSSACSLEPRCGPFPQFPSTTRQGACARPPPKTASVRPPTGCLHRRPSAATTWLGSSEPAAHALPAEAAMPSRSSRISSASDGAPPNATERIAGWRGAPAPFTSTSGIAETIAASSRSRIAATRGAVSARSASASASAVAKPAMPGTFSVPARKPCSCPPPTISGSSGVPLRTYKAPTPF